jgi:hypothetical protein
MSPRMLQISESKLLAAPGFERFSKDQEKGMITINYNLGDKPRGKDVRCNGSVFRTGSFPTLLKNIRS